MILGIDLGQRITGLATSESSLATPYKTIKHQSRKEALRKIIEICDELRVDKVVVGFVEGKIKSLFENFASALKKARPNFQIVLWDETLTTRQARQTMIKLQVPKIKRRKLEHEVAAAIILQSYLDSIRN
ncbi:Holliday junction resolvase RuvX [Candidatus Curtissbacteria bacterium]|nr:Holliday junction resolvase RuvX [Candidatus Curtissbacteria bacterium]